MSRRRNSIDGQFAARTIAMLRSPPWGVLTLAARRVLDRLEIELADHGGNDNGRLPVTYDDFVRYGLDRHAVAPAIRECVALGFLHVTEPGRAGNADFRSPNHFRLTYRPTAHAGPTDEWRRITTNEQAEQAKSLARGARASVAKKQKSSGGFRHVSVGENPTER